MELTLDQALQKGIEAHKAGKVQEADRYYTAILKANPKHSDANHKMGILAVGVGKVEAALPFFKTALEANPKISQFWLSYIDALIKLDRMDDARAILGQAKSSGIKGDGFDQLELQLEVSLDQTERSDDNLSEVVELPQDRLQPLLNLYNQSKFEQVFLQTQELIKNYPGALVLWNLMGASAAQTRRLDQAVFAFQKAISIKPDSSDAYNNLGNVFQDQDKQEEAIDAYTKAISIKPDSAEAYYNKGVSLEGQGKFEEAIEAYEQAIALKPDYVKAYNNLGNALKEQNKLEEALKAFQQAMSIKPSYAEAHSNIGNVLKEQGKFEEAIEAYDRAIALKPDYADAYNNLGNALKEQGKLDEATEAYKKAIKIKPNSAEPHNNIGNVLFDQGKLEEAIEAYNKALSIDPSSIETYSNLGVTLQGQNKLEEAIDAFNKALSINSYYPEAYNNMATILQDQGKLDEAIKVYNRALSIRPEYSEVHRNLSTIMKYTGADAQFNKVKDLLTKDGLSDDAKCNLNFALAKMYEDFGDLRQAFGCLSEGNRLRKKILKYTIEQDEKLFEKLKETQPLFIKYLAEIKDSSCDPKPIFILGMPRSGTTLIEQIVSSHSKVTAAGELDYVNHYGLGLGIGVSKPNKETISEFRVKYLSAISKRANGYPLITDKMPQNFRFIPVICATFPEAKIIHIKRNAAATCWSSYKQYFTTKGLGYCYDLKDVVAYYDLYIDLMKVWQTFYGDRIYNLDYESLTNDQESESKKLINYLDLPWEEACLSPQENKRSVRTASQQQVRKKIYRGSSKVWRKYEPFLNGAFDNLSSS